MCADSRNGAEWHGADPLRRQVDGHGLDWRSASFHRVRLEAARLERYEAWGLRISSACGRVVGIQFALEELADKDWAVMDRNHVGDKSLAKARRQRRREVPHLVGMRKHNVGGLNLLHYLFERKDVAVRRVILQQQMLDRIDFAEGFAAEFARKRRNSLT